MWFVHEANSDVMHTCFNHGGDDVHLLHVMPGKPSVLKPYSSSVSGMGMFLSHIKPEKHLIPEGDNASNPGYHDGWEVVLFQWC